MQAALVLGQLVEKSPGGHGGPTTQGGPPVHPSQGLGDDGKAWPRCVDPSYLVVYDTAWWSQGGDSRHPGEMSDGE